MNYSFIPTKMFDSNFDKLKVISKIILERNLALPEGVRLVHLYVRTDLVPIQKYVKSRIYEI